MAIEGVFDRETGSVVFTGKAPVHVVTGPYLLCIDGWYQHKEHGKVKITHIHERTSAVVTRKKNGRDVAWLVSITDLTGPTNIPCPFCGKLQIVRSEDGMQIDLGEHVERGRIWSCIAPVGNNEPQPRTITDDIEEFRNMPPATKLLIRRLVDMIIAGSTTIED